MEIRSKWFRLCLILLNVLQENLCGKLIERVRIYFLVTSDKYLTLCVDGGCFLSTVPKTLKFQLLFAVFAICQEQESGKDGCL